MIYTLKHYKTVHPTNHIAKISQLNPFETVTAEGSRAFCQDPVQCFPESVKHLVITSKTCKIIGDF